MNHRILGTLLLFLPLLLACGVTDSGEPPAENPVRLNLGTESQLATQSIGSGGGTLLVPSTVDTLGGLTITVPPDAYPEARTFTLSYAPITGIENGGDYTIISPAIIVENGGDYAEDMMTVKVPVTVPEGMFAMAFAYDESGAFEALPILDQDASSVTLWTTHFEHSAVHDPPLEKRVIGHGVAAGRRRTMLAIIAYNKEKIMQANVPTAFVPGVDDWQFRNYGSTIAPGGHCAGQSWGMMYYFMDQKQKKRAPALHGRFDNDQRFATPNIQYDDASAYRYCSALQANYNTFIKVGNSFDRHLAALGKTQTFLDSLMFMAFKLGMHVTKAPQFITVWTASSDAGHAMVIYGATAGELKICDPNFPGSMPEGKNRTVKFTGGKFEPYNSGADAENLGTAYPVIWFYATTSGMNWTVAKNEWPHVPKKSGGASYFPGFTVRVRDTASDQFTPLTDGWKSGTGRVQVEIVSSSPYATRALFQPDGTILRRDATGWFSIPDGRNQIGFYVQDTSLPKTKWAGFRWFEIVGRDAPPVPRCTRDKHWETALNGTSYVYTDSTSKGRRFILEDLSEPEDICSDVHIHPKWEVTGDLSGLKITASAYWSLFGEDLPLTVAGNKATGSMEIGLKQAFDDDPGYVGLQTEITFPSRGSLAADIAYLARKRIVSRISMDYKEHAE